MTRAWGREPGPTPCPVGWSAASPASAHFMPVAALSCDARNVSRQWQVSPRGQDLPQLKMPAFQMPQTDALVLTCRRQDLGGGRALLKVVPTTHALVREGRNPRRSQSHLFRVASAVSALYSGASHGFPFSGALGGLRWPGPSLFLSVPPGGPSPTASEQQGLRPVPRPCKLAPRSGSCIAVPSARDVVLPPTCLSPSLQLQPSLSL